MSKITLLAITTALMATLGACGEQGYSPTNSYGARVGSTGTAADAAANNGSTSTTMEAQRQKVDNYNGVQPGYR